MRKAITDDIITWNHLEIVFYLRDAHKMFQNSKLVPTVKHEHVCNQARAQHPEPHRPSTDDQPAMSGYAITWSTRTRH